MGESRPNQVAFLQDLEMSTGTVRSLRDMLDARSLRGEFVVEGQEIFQSFCMTDHTSETGRARYADLCYN